MCYAKDSESIKIAKKETYQLNRENVLESHKKKYSKTGNDYSVKVQKFLRQVWHDPYFISTLCHHSLYERSVQLFDEQKYDDFLAQLHDPISSFNEKFYICHTCNETLRKKSQSQARQFVIKLT